MNVLVPMDFTEVSLNGLDYAFNRFPNSNITAIHVLSGVVHSPAPILTKPSIPDDVNTIKRLEASIIQHLQAEKLPTNINVETYYGEPVNVISNYLIDHAFDAVVIGSRDKYNLLDKIIGTTSLGVVKRSEIPVFVIPKFAKYKNVNKIMVGCDETVSDNDTLMAINYWNSTNAQVKFLHIKVHIKDNKEVSFEETKKQLVKNLYEDYQPPFTYEIEEQQSENVSDSLLANAYNYGADLLVIVAQKSSFLKTLFFKSNTKELIQKSNIPILFLHKREIEANN